MYMQDMVCWISRDTFEIPHKISYPYIERYDCPVHNSCVLILLTQLHYRTYRTISSVSIDFVLFRKLYLLHNLKNMIMIQKHKERKIISICNGNI